VRAETAVSKASNVSGAGEANKESDLHG
jgi:hypothetical protein